MENSGKRKQAPQVPAKQEQNTSQEAKKMPMKTFRADDCSASIWHRERFVEGTPMVFYSVTLERSYVDRNGKRQWTHSYDPDSLGKIVQLCQMASEFIGELQERQ